jgi:hypothetical protein
MSRLLTVLTMQHDSGHICSVKILEFKPTSTTFPPCSIVEPILVEGRKDGGGCGETANGAME